MGVGVGASNRGECDVVSKGVWDAVTEGSGMIASFVSRIENPEWYVACSVPGCGTSLTGLK